MIVGITTSKPDQEVIDALKELLADAEAGRIQSIVYAVLLDDGSTGNGWHGMDKNNVTLLGELTIMQRDVMDCLIDLRIDPATGESNI